MSISTSKTPATLAPPNHKPRITISLSTSSTLSRQASADPFIITLTATLHYHTRITINTLSSIFRTHLPDNATFIRQHDLSPYLDFISVSPEHEDILAKPVTSTTREDEEDKEPIKLYWADQEDFLHLEPEIPLTIPLKLGPWRLAQPIYPYSSPTWGPADALSPNAEYEVRLKEGVVKWWKDGYRDYFLKVVKGRDKGKGNWFLGWLLGHSFRECKGTSVLDEGKWISLELEGEAPRFRVVD